MDDIYPTLLLIGEIKPAQSSASTSYNTLTRYSSPWYLSLKVWSSLLGFHSCVRSINLRSRSGQSSFSPRLLALG